GIQLAITVSLCTYLGYLADQWLDTLPIALLVGAFLGLGAGMWSAVKTIDRVTGRAKAMSESEKGASDDSP
ncbi:MAG: F0F1-type ATP synthase assembly protein I, partial [Pseudohongiellaceae bacterium]